MLDSLLTALAALGTLLTAYFMLPTFLSSVPVMRLSVSNFPNALIQGSEGKQLQQDGFFLLHIIIDAPPNHSVSLKTLEVRGGSIPKGIADKYGRITEGDAEHLVMGRVPFPVQISHGQSLQCQFLVRADTPEEGDFEVIVRYGIFGKIRRLVPYHQTKSIFR